MQAMFNSVQKRQNALDAQTAALELLSPYAALKRGYAIVQRKGQTIAEAAQLHAGDVISIRLADGVVSASVLDEEEGHG